MPRADVVSKRLDDVVKDVYRDVRRLERGLQL